MKPWFEKWGDNPDDPEEGIDAWMAHGHSSFACFAHHNSFVAAEFNIQQPFIIDPFDYSPGGDYPPLSKSQHGWHGPLQQGAQGKLLRDANGNSLLWGDPGNQNPITLAMGRNRNTLFPTDGDRPMEDNCLKCHAGKREQIYRDHHYTVGLKCAACHGPGHALWPNRDPKANDNVTAVQLQGYPGSVMECKVCHTKDAFSQLASLDAGAVMQKAEGVPADSGFLGGPHGMRPVNDPNWWARATADTTTISDGSTWGGWHDNVYRQPDRQGGDQCAACHDADHKGTRLSRTPVALVFAVKNGRKARWKAGDLVGCDRPTAAACRRR